MPSAARIMRESPLRGQELAGVAARRLVLPVGAEHATDLRDQLLAVHPLHDGAGLPALRELLDPEVRRCERGNLGQVRDADHLASLADPPQPLPHGTGRFAADPGVDLVEDQRSGPGVGAEAGERQHHARQLAARRRVPQRGDGKTRVGGDHEGDALAPARPVAVGVRLERNLKRGALHRELGELRRHPPLQPASRLRTSATQLVRERGPLLRGVVHPLLQLDASLLGALQPPDRGSAALRVREHRLDRAAVLSLQAIDHVESLLDLLQAPRLGVDPIEVATQLAGQVGKLDRHPSGPLGERIEVAVHARCSRQRRIGLGQQRRRAATVLVIPRHGRERATRREAQALRVVQPLALGAELALLGRLQLRPLDLLQLVAQDVQVPLARPLALAKLRQLALQRGQLGVRLAVATPSLQVLRTGKPVQYLELRRGQGELAVLVLTVEGKRAGAQRPQVGRGGRAALHEGARPPRDPDPATEHDLVRARWEPLADLAQPGVVVEPVGKRQDPLHVGLLGAGADDLRPRLAPHQQVDRVREDRLPGPGLAGDRVEAPAEPKLGPLDQEQVLDTQLVQHAARSSDGCGRIRPYAAAGSAAASAPRCCTKSRERTSANPTIPPTIAIAAPTSRMSLKPLMKAWFAASATWARLPGGTDSTAARPPPADTASPSPGGAPGSSSPSRVSMRDWKIAPRAATPVAIPTWRKVLLIPDAIPARNGATTPIAVEAIAGLVSPMPTPATRKPGSSVVQSSPTSIPRISSRPTPTSIRPRPSRIRAGIRPDSFPAIGATKKESRVMGRNRTPASS